MNGEISEDSFVYIIQKSGVFSLGKSVGTALLVSSLFRHSSPHFLFLIDACADEL